MLIEISYELTDCFGGISTNYFNSWTQSDPKILKLTTFYGENSSSDHARIWSTNRVKITVKVASNM